MQHAATLNICPDQAGRNQMYHTKKVATAYCLYTSLHQISKVDNRCLDLTVLTYILWMNKRLHRRHYNENRYLLI